MTEWVRESRGARSILAVLFALVLAIRIAIPTGFMPTSAPSGIVISVCTGMGQVKAFLPTGKEGDQDRHGTAEQPCTFAAALGALLFPPLPDAMAPIAAALDAPAPRALAHLTTHRLAAPPPPAIGPPARA